MAVRATLCLAALLAIAAVAAAESDVTELQISVEVRDDSRASRMKWS